jgi:type I restriction enzyme M protein
MLTHTELRSKVDLIWNKLWTGGLSNPLDAIEQLSYLLFLKMMDDEEINRERMAARRNTSYVSSVPDDIRWRHWTQFPATKALAHLKEKVFPYLREMGDETSSFRRYMANAECKINKATLLIEVAGLIDLMDISAQNQDIKGDIYEYLLSHLNTAGRNGQFRTPRHIIDMMVRMIDPKPMERIGDLAAGTAGFLVGAYQYILEQHTSPDVWQHGEGNRAGDLLTQEEREFLNNGGLRGFDNDSGMTMLRIGSMNLMLHGIDNPKFFYRDTLSKDYDEPQAYDVILMNPPFKGAVDKDDVNENLPSDTTKSELLFLHRILRSLDMGGRCAVIVPDGVLFGDSRAHTAVREKLIEENRLDGVVSMPSGIFKPYAGGEHSVVSSPGEEQPTISSSTTWLMMVSPWMISAHLLQIRMTSRTYWPVGTTDTTLPFSNSGRKNSQVCTNRSPHSTPCGWTWSGKSTDCSLKKQLPVMMTPRPMTPCNKQRETW